MADLRAAILPWQRQQWLDEAKTLPNSSRKARLLLWVGEYDLAHHQPLQASERLARVAAMLGQESTDRGLARFDEAYADLLHGSFAQSAVTSKALLTSHLKGYNRRLTLLLERHAEACLGYHDGHTALGIPEPPSLDPLCGVAGVAVCLQHFGLRHDQSYLEQIVPHDGEGSSIDQLQKALSRMGLVAQGIGLSKTEALMKLPLPAIAHVERDHFVTITRADEKGVSYLCSDCGPWPGGEVRLSWKQWKAMDADRFIAVAAPGTAEALALTHLPDTLGGTVKRIDLAAKGTAGAAVSAAAERWLAGMRKYATAYLFPIGAPFICGTRGTCPQCPCFEKCPMYSPPGGCSGSVHPLDPINMATGEEELAPGPDLVLYNPTGPSVVWGVTWNSLGNSSWAGGGGGGVPTGFGSGWSHTYNWRVEHNWTGSSWANALDMPNGSMITWAEPSHTGNPWSAQVTPSIGGVPFIITENGNAAGATSYVITFKDQSFWTFNVSEVQGVDAPPFTAGTSCEFFYPGQITDKFGNYITLQYALETVATPDPSTGQFDSFQLNYICNSAGSPIFYVDYAATVPTDDFVQSDFVAEWPTSQSDTLRSGIVYGFENIAILHPDNSSGFPQSCDELSSESVPSKVTLSGSVVSVSSSLTKYVYGYGYYNNNDQNQGLAEQIPYLTNVSALNPSDVDSTNYDVYQGGSAGSSTATVTYATNGAVSTVKDALGNVTTLTDLSSGSTNKSSVTVVDGSGNTAEVLYAYWNTSPSLSPSEYQLSTNGQQSGVITPIQFQYNDPNDPYLPSMATDGNGRQWKYSYDVYGNTLTETTPATTLTTNLYNYAFAGGLIKSSTVSGKTPTTFGYYANGALETVTTPIPGQADTLNTETTTYTYTTMGNVKSIVSAGNNAVGTHETQFSYTLDGSRMQAEALGQPIAITDTLGYIWHYWFDEFCNETTFEDPNGNTWNYTYNLANQLQSITDPVLGSGSSVENLIYLYIGGPLVNVQSVDANSNVIRQEIIEYNAEGLVASHFWKDPVGGGFVTDAQYGYTGIDQIANVVDGNGQETYYKYDDAGRLQSAAYPLSNGNYDKIQFQSYDPVGNLTTRLDGNGQTTSYTYGSADGLLSAVAYSSDPGQNVSLTYDAYDRVHATSDGTGSSSTQYDDLDNITSSTRTYSDTVQATFTYGYYPDGTRQTISNLAGAFTYLYDGNSNCTTVESPAGNTTIDYAINRRPYKEILPNGYSSSYAFYAPGALQYVSWYNNSNTTIGNYQVTHYDGLYDETGASASFSNYSQYSGTMTRQYSTESGGVINHYDGVGRLLSDVSTANGGYNYTFNYDGASNPTTFRNNTVQYNADNQFQNSVTYDGNGCPTSYFGASIAPDPESRVASWGSSWTAGYRADGLRAYKSTQSQQAPPPTVSLARLTRRSVASASVVARPMRKAAKGRSKQAIAGLTYYFYDGGVPVLETNSAGTVTAYNVFGPLGLIARVASGTPTFYQFDSEGNVAVRSNNATPTPAVTSYSTYDAYGKESDSVQNLTDPFGYKGQFGYYYDRENKLNLCGLRYYDPGHGRWLNRDPIGYAGGTNLYGYCESNPVGSADALGAGPAATIAALVGTLRKDAGPGGCTANDPLSGLGGALGPLLGIGLGAAAVGAAGGGGEVAGGAGVAGGAASEAAGASGASRASEIPGTEPPEGRPAQTSIQERNVSGLAAQDTCFQNMLQAGMDVEQNPGYIRTEHGLRKPDIAVYQGQGEDRKVAYYVEVKTRGAKYPRMQRRKDRWIEQFTDGNPPTVVISMP